MLCEARDGTPGDHTQDKKYRKKEDTSPLQVLTTRREALALCVLCAVFCVLCCVYHCTPTTTTRYRDIWRNSMLFVWKDEKGRVWCVEVRFLCCSSLHIHLQAGCVERKCSQGI